MHDTFYYQVQYMHKAVHTIQKLGTQGLHKLGLQWANSTSVAGVGIGPNTAVHHRVSKQVRASL